LRNGQSLYGLNGTALREICPTIIFTQSLCDVCAVSYPVVIDACAKLLGGGEGEGEGDGDDGERLNPKVISMEPTTLKETLRTFHVAAEAVGLTDAARRAEEITSHIRAGLETIRNAADGRPRPRVAFLEWHDPIFAGGHWIPDMLDMAGAEYVFPVKSGERSVGVADEHFVEFDPDFILIGPCGFGLERTVKDTLQLARTKPWWKEMSAVREGNVYALDGNSYYARPGPRLLQGTGIMAACIHGEETAKELGEELCPTEGYCQIMPGKYRHGIDDDFDPCRATIKALSAVPLLSPAVLCLHPSTPLFVAWNGVLVLVYEGFPPSLVQCKRRIEMFLGSGPGEGGLKEENFGSKWPKTTLGALDDDNNEGKVSLEELTTLRDLCARHSSRILSLPRRDADVAVRSVSAVEYECRSLEKLRSRTDLDLLPSTASPSSDDNDEFSFCSAEERERTQSVVDEWNDDLDSYLSKVNAPGSRIQSYRDASTAGGRTCAVFVDDDAMPSALRRCLGEFRRDVDVAFPGRYSWMGEGSLHCTLRSLG